MTEIKVSRLPRGGFILGTRKVSPAVVSPSFPLSDSDYMSNLLGIDADKFYAAIKTAEEYGEATIKSPLSAGKIGSRVEQLRRRGEYREAAVKQKQENKQDITIEILEDVRIPGTDVILEKGDKVNVMPKTKVREGFDFEDELYSEMSSRPMKLVIETFGAYLEDNYDQAERLTSSQKIESLLSAISMIV